MKLQGRLMPTAAAALAAFILSNCFHIDPVSANFFANPTPKWSVQLQGSGRVTGRGLRKGNAIVAVKDGTKIVVTANDGSLHIIQTTNQVKSLAVYVPDVITGTNTESRSGAVIVYKSQQDGLYFPVEEGEENSALANEDLIIYAVIDRKEAPDDEINDSGTEADGIIDHRGSGTTSRVVALNMEGAFKWSVSVPGLIEGTPVVGKTGIYVTHNVNGYGALSILNVRRNDGKANIAATVTTVSDNRGETIPLGPPTLRAPASGEDDSNSGDMVIVAGKWDDGFSENQGGLYMLTSVANTDKKNKDDKNPDLASENGNYQLVQISSWPYSAIAPPLVYGDSIFMGGAGGTIGGFTGDRRSDLSGIISGKENEISPRWNYQVSPNAQNPSQPIRSQPVLDSEGQFLCVPGVDNDFYCFQSDNGREIWKAQEDSQIFSRPHVFEGDERRKVVYAIESRNGRVRQYDLYSGRRYWDHSCADVSNQFCRDPVEAEFAITPSGNTIYYGDVFGRIHSLEVANFETESPTIAPTSVAATSPSGNPTVAPVPTSAEVPTQIPQVEQTTSSSKSDDETSMNVIIIDGGTDQQGQQGGGSDDGDSGAITEANFGSNTASTIDQQSSAKDFKKLTAYVGAGIAGLCLLMIPIVLFSMIRKRRKRKSSSDDMVIEIIDDFSSDDLESQSGLDFIKSIETNNSDPNDGDGIEVEIIEHGTTPRGNPKQDRKKKKVNSPDTPNTVDTLESIDESPKDSPADEHNVTVQSVEAVNLRQTFDKEALKDNFSDDDVPPPPPDSEESPLENKLTWGSLLQIGTSQSSKSIKDTSEVTLDKYSEDPESKQSAHGTSPSPGKISIDERLPVQKQKMMPMIKFQWRKKGKKVSNHLSTESEQNSEEKEKDQAESLPTMVDNETSEMSGNEALDVERDPEAALSQFNQHENVEESNSVVVRESFGKEEEKQMSNEVTESAIPPTPTSPSAYSTLSDAIQSLSPVRSIESVQDSLLSSPNPSSTKSVGSDDESLYTSFTGGTNEKKQEAKDLSPLSNFVYDQDIYRRGRSEIVNERQRFLAQPFLSKPYARYDEEEYPDDEHPDDEISLAPGNQYLSEETNGQKNGRSVNSKKDNTVNEFKHRPISEMYDQLAAIGQQRREEKKPGFNRRNKRLEQESIIPQKEEQGDKWGSLLNEVDEVEEQFNKAQSGQRNSLLNGVGSEDSEDAELSGINGVSNN